MTIQYNRNTIRTAVLLEHTVFDIVTQTNCRTQWTMQYKCNTEWTIQQTASRQNTSMHSEYSNKLQTAVHITQCTTTNNNIQQHHTLRTAAKCNTDDTTVWTSNTLWALQFSWNTFQNNVCCYRILAELKWPLCVVKCGMHYHCVLYCHNVLYCVAL